MIAREKTEAAGFKMEALLLVFISPFLVLMVASLVRRVYRLRKALRAQPDLRRCRCGYALTGLDIPRCPECGRAIGFDCTFEDLGIAEKDVRDYIERKKQADASGKPE